MKALSVAVAAAFLCLTHAPARADAPAPAALAAALGGSLSDPVAVGDYVYVPQGATISAWSRAQPGAPVALGDTRTAPAKGWLTGLAHRGDYLYASYRGYDSLVSGVAVYSIADRAHPVLVGQYGDYTTSKIRFAMSVAIAGDSLLLLDSENGIYTGNLGDPSHPVFTQSYPGFGAYARAQVDGNRLYTSGRSFLGGTIVTVFDVSNPAAIEQIGSQGLDGFDNFSVRFRAPYSFGFGLAVAVTDFSDPASPLARGRVDSPVSYNGVLIGNHAWGVGGFDGVEVFDVADLDAPAHVGTVAIDTFSTDVTATAGSEGWLATRDDRLIRVDGTNAAQPALAGSALLAGGTSAYDVAFKDDAVYFLGNAFGLQVAEPGTYAPLGRYVTSLEQSLQGRAFEQVAVDGNRAYLTSWGSGLLIADVTNARAPTELGYFEFPFATSIAANGNYAYVGTSTNGGILAVLDVSNPATPTVVGTYTSQPPIDDKYMRFALHGDLLFIADQPMGGTEGAGLRILSVANPAQPVDVALFGDCGAANDVALNPAGTLAVVACHDKTWLVDVSTPATPVALGSYDGDAYAVAIHGERIYVGRATGVDEVDISNRAAPTLVRHSDTPDTPRRITASPDGRVFVMHGLSGTYVFESDALFADGFEQ
ncbi:MAG TPA: hypothetical protein VJ724_14455 [Tahibacter sp.]|nr:hypothetical protein [Tahibacter sp.]